MANIEKRYIINGNHLNPQFYFASLLQEAYACGLLFASDIERIQLQCFGFLAKKTEKYNGGDSSSIRVEIAENIMKSNLYTMGLYLKTLPNADCAVSELKTSNVVEIYQRGRKIIDDKLQVAMKFYRLAQNNKLITINYTYNATLDDNGIGAFFKAYDPDYAAHEIPASIDYQLCNPITDLAGVEFIEKYLANLFLENEFCTNFAPEDINGLLYGYDEGYQDLLINIFEHVFTGALGCWLAQRNVVKLNIPVDQIEVMYNGLARNIHSLDLILSKASEGVLAELNITNPALQRYLAKNLPKIKTNITHAIETNNLDKVFVPLVNPNLKPKIEFSPEVKMDDAEYRKLINELLSCRYASDKLILIKEQVKSFDDLEDVLFDAQLSQEEIILIFKILEDVEIALLIRRYPYKSDVQAVDLSEKEQVFRLYLKNYLEQLPYERQEQIFELMDRLIDENLEI
ncbi:DUF6179 domain-containing protein [Desulfotomaculum sp. 1211_IL3151]|uniref:DUF6179 domain-containing protein n=1 Tax=Desulfotomaculum sp. 1211_IL3151 TaxID=3084055 RepID=UPI002FDADFDB